MKIFGNIYTNLSLKDIIDQLVLPSWKIEKRATAEFLITADSLQLSFEGQGEILVFGEVDVDIDSIDRWIKHISILKISYSIDLHGDEARLMRRYQQ